MNGRGRVNILLKAKGSFLLYGKLSNKINASEVSLFDRCG